MAQTNCFETVTLEGKPKSIQIQLDLVKAAGGWRVSKYRAWLAEPRAN
jgi:hypothetical protein